MSKYDPLPTIELSESSRYPHPASLPEVVHIDDPAFSVMYDFKLVQPLTVYQDTQLDDALTEMKISGTHELLVIDENDLVTGLVGSEDILGTKPIQLMQRDLMERSEIQAKMIMRKMADLIAIDLKSLYYAKVGHVLKTLQEHKAQYAFVVQWDENSGQQSMLRGMFSFSEIHRHLHHESETS